MPPCWMLGLNDFFHHVAPRAGADERIAGGQIRASNLHVEQRLLRRLVFGVQESPSLGSIRGAQAFLLAGQAVVSVETPTV